MASAATAESNMPVAGQTALVVEVNVADDVIGSVHDLIVGAGGEVSLAILEVGGFLGLGLQMGRRARKMKRRADGMWWESVIGLVHIVAGIFFLANPLGGIIALTIMLGAAFIAEGMLRLIMAAQMERSGQLFLLIASGALSILLGIMVFWRSVK